MSRELVIYTDESERFGKHFGNFYGAAIVRSQDLAGVTAKLADRIAELGLTGELKWKSINTSIEERYRQVLDTAFELVGQDQLKIRVMFTQNMVKPRGLSKEHIENQYHLLYYQFIKHGLGLRYANDSSEELRIRLNVDQMPAMAEKNANFKGFIANLSKSPEFRHAKIVIPPLQIAEIRSHDHKVLQTLDVILGAIAFRLNDRHRELLPGKKRRGNRTLAKERVYKHILGHIQRLRPNFNIGISTGIDADPANRWNHSYRHWLFKPSDHEIDRTLGKKKAP